MVVIKKLILRGDKMEDCIVIEDQFQGGIQKVYKFENGYGASIVKHRFSYDLWEMALLVFEDSEDGELLWKVIYREDFANGDVAGYLNDKDVLKLLEWIKAL